MKKSSFCVVLSLLWLVSGTTAQPVQWSIADGGNGHYYEAVLVPDGISWTDADLAAGSREGDWHLATITSAEENAFVYDLVDDDPAFWKRGGTSGNWGGPWIGGYQVGDTGPWYWVTGEPFSLYQNWGPLEPFGNGDKIALFGYQARMGPYWNDAYDRHMYFGYVIESGTFSPPAPPDVDAGESRTCQRGVEIILMAAFSDNSSDTHTAWWDFDGDGIFDQEGTVEEQNGCGEVYGRHVYDMPGEYTAWVCVEDDKGESACDDVVVIVLVATNQPPVAQCQDVTVQAGPDCGADAIVDGGSYDPDGDPITIEQTPPGPYSLGTTEITLTVTDDSGASDTCTAIVTVVDASQPVITSVTPDSQVVPVGSPANFAVAVQDNCACDAAVWQFDVDNPLPEEFGDCGLMSHTYSSPGIYTVGVVAVDTAGNVSDPAFMYVVVYDPSGGFVTGGGWIWSPPGAYKPEPELEGKANFAFVSKYKRGVQAPTGNTEFQFHSGNLNFHSGNYDWLVVTGSDYARFKGWGTINGAGEYKFMLWAGDDADDTLRIRIWEEDEAGNELVIYDNGTDQLIAGGSIIVHSRD